jgi:hypothetical protein
MLTNTSPYRLDLHISKDYILQSKGLSHRLMDPHAVSTLLFRLKTAFLDYMHVLTPLKEQHWKPFIFCKQHPREAAGQPIGIFSTTDPKDPEWNLRVVPEGHRLEGSTEETLRGTMRFMGVQHHYQLLLRHEMGQLINTARSYYREADRQVTQVDQL